MTGRLSLNRNQLKYLVIAAMLIDHIAWAFVPMDTVLGQVMHFIGRLTGPTMAYFIAEGYYYTRNFGKYALRLGIFAFLSWLPFVYFEFGCMPIVIEDGMLMGFYPFFGVLYTLFLGLMAIRLWDSKLNTAVKVFGIIGLCILSLFGDWAVFDVLWCLFFFCYRNNPKEQWIAYFWVALVCCLSVLGNDPWWSGLWMLGIFMVPFLIRHFYNGQSGSKHPFNKWFFYIFYPAHLLVLGVLRWVVF